ncbi:hypothetical protein LTR35_017876, partial [Friedmanniomyces endolithicus]
ITIADTNVGTEDFEDSRDQESDFFITQHVDISLGPEDAIRAVNYVEGSDQHHSTAVTWLQTTGIADHVCGPRKYKIQSRVALPNENDEPILHSLTVVMRDVLHTAHC